MARDSHNSEQQEKCKQPFSHYGQSETQLFFWTVIFFSPKHNVYRKKISQSDSGFSACALQIASPTIHPVLQTIHTIDSTLTDLCEVRLAQISSTRSFTTPAKNKKTALWVGIYRLLPVNSPLGSSPEWIPDRFATRLSCWPAVPAATLTWSLLTLAIQPHPGCKSLARQKKKELPWNACWLAKWLFVSQRAGQILSVFDTSPCYQRWSWDYGRLSWSKNRSLKAIHPVIVQE